MEDAPAYDASADSLRFTGETHLRNIRQLTFGVRSTLRLLGVRPRWQAESQRLGGVEVIPLAELGRKLSCPNERRIVDLAREVLPEYL